MAPFVSLVALLAGCTPPDPAESPPSAGCSGAAIEYPAVTTTLTQRLVADPALERPLDVNPASPEGLAAAEAQGLGGWTVAEGESRMVRDDLAPGHGTTGARRSLALFLHESDAQIADTESPTRMVGADAIGATESAERPQELYAIHALDALLRTADALGEVVKIDFGLATGDNADNAQANELTWFQNVWDGTPFRPDSADPDSQLDDDCNDPLADFTPVGADFPWYAVAGNHDVLVQGNFDPVPFTDEALGADAPFGTRDLSVPGGPLAWVAVPDASRAVLERSDIASILLDTPATPGPVGHGFTDADVAADVVDWVATPVAGVPVVVIAVDANPPDLGDAMMTVAERDQYLIPALEAAEAAGQLVIVTSHYALATLRVEDGTVLGDVLMAHPNVILTVAGHSHVNDIQPYGTPGDPGAFWEIRTSSTVDWPGQGRLVELVDNGDGTLSVFTTMFDYLAPEGSMAARARALSLIDLQGGWRGGEGTGEVEDRNTELVQVLPVGWTTVAGTDGVRSEALP